MKTIVMLFCLLLIGCMDNGVKVANDAQPGTAGKIAFALSKTAIPQDIASLTFTLTNLSTSETVSKTLVVSTDTVMQVEFDQLAVGAWHVKVVAKDSTSGTKYSGESDANVIEGQTTQLSLSLTTLTSGAGTLVITVNWPGTSPFVDYSGNPILQSRGKWYDIKGPGYPVVLADEGKYKMWFMNYGLANGPYLSIGLAESVDGTTWTRVADTVLTPTPGAWDRAVVSPLFVNKENGVYTMYYVGESDISMGYNVGMATSQDGINWTKTQVIMPGVNNIAGASVVKVNSQYYLYYHTASSVSIHLAISSDGVNWQKSLTDPVLTPTQTWETGALAYGSVVYENNVFTMVYSNTDYSNSFGFATSTDGIHWTKDTRNPIFSRTDCSRSWQPNSIGYPFFVRVGNELRLYYTGAAADGTLRIGYAVKR